MKFLISLYTLLLVLQACDPPADCTDIRCIDSPIITKLKANLSDTSYLLRIGDTLKLFVEIPDTLTSNYGNISVSTVQKATVSIRFYSVDSIVSKTIFAINSESYLLKIGKFASQSQIVEFNNDMKKIEVNFPLKKKGKFYIQMGEQSQRLELTQIDGSKLLVMTHLGFNNKNMHTELYLSWINDSVYRTEAQSYLNNLAADGIGFYAFNVE